MNARLNLKKLEVLLSQSVGLDVASFGPQGLERAVAIRERILGTQARNQYWEAVRRRPEELQALVEELVVSETWFHRESAALEALAAQGTRLKDLATKDRPIRILSAPCATGEEPLSIAMALLDSGWEPDHFRVLGSDISRRSLESAASGRFTSHSFRTLDLSFRDRYFREIVGGYEASDVLMSTVRFEHGNLVAPDFMAHEPPFDFVFCRNLFIYLSDPARQQALTSVLHLVRDGGGVFVGAAECRLLNQPPFMIEKTGTTFMFRPRKLEEASATLDSLQAKHGSLTRVSGKPLGSLPERTPLADGLEPARLPPLGLRSSQQRAVGAGAIAEAYRLADGGRLKEAAVICESILSKGAASPQALYLLGLVRDAEGDSASGEALYRKALYLDPTYYEALVQLSLIRKRHGDFQESRVLQERANRALNQQEVSP